MISNFHTHTTFSDSENTPEEVVLTAIDNGFASIGFSDHGYTDFDLITKFDEQGEYFFLENKEYTEIAQWYISDAAQSGCFFEVNTGAISRGYRSTAYPYENLLYILKKNGNGIVLSSDSHNVGTLSFKFDDMRCYLKDLGFRYVYHLYNGQFVKDYL